MGLSQSWYDDLANPADILILLQCALLVVLGSMLQSDVPEEVSDRTHITKLNKGHVKALTPYKRQAAIEPEGFGINSR